MIGAAVPDNEAERLASVRALALLDTPPEERFERITRVARQCFDVPIALISLVDGQREWFKSRAGLAQAETNRALAFSAYAILDDQPLVVSDVLSDARFADHPFVTGAPHMRFYAAYPIHAPSGHRVGALCVADLYPRSFSPAQIQLLADLASWTESELRALSPAQEPGRPHSAEDEAARARRIALEIGATSDLKSALLACMRVVAGLTGWELGQVWLPRADRAVLVRGPAWYRHAASPGTFETGAEDMTLASGAGTPGQAWAARAPAWHAGVGAEARFARVAAARKAEAKASAAIPLLAHDSVVAVLEFCVLSPGPQEARRLPDLENVTTQLGAALYQKQVEFELRAQKQLFESLTAVARATAGGPDLEATLQNALDVAIELTQAEYGSVFLLNDDGRVTHSILGKSGLIQRHDLIDQVMAHGLAGWVARHGQAALVADTLQDERWLTLPRESYNARSALVVPIMSASALRGILTLLHSQVEHFTPEHLTLMTAAADHMALAVRNAQSYEALRYMAERRTTLYEVLRALSGWYGVDAVVQAAVRAIVQYTGRSSVAIALWDTAQPGHWAIRAALGEFSPEVGVTHSVGEGIVGRALATGQTQYVPDVMVDEDYLVGHPGVRSELAVLMWRGERILGVLNLESDQLEAFDGGEISLAESLADAVALALDNARLVQTIADERSRLQSLIESSRDGVLLVGAHGTLHVVNRAALQLLQLPGEPDEWLNRQALALLWPLRRHAPAAVRTAVRELRPVQPGADPERKGEVHVGPRVLSWLSLPVLAEVTDLGRLLVLRDVTEERQLDQLRDDLMHTLVHDLRNPLTVIISALQLYHFTTPPRHDLVEVARASAERMLDLVNSILDVGRLENGQMPLDRQPVALAALVDELFRLQSPLAGEVGVRLESDLAPALPPVWADPNLLRRVLQNLLSNGLRFAPPGSVVRVTAEWQMDRKVLVRVIDSGPGISGELQGHLFEKFASSETAGRGTGLGLLFCRLVVEAHGGRIWVDSSPRSGATFLFTLPVFQGG